MSLCARPVLLFSRRAVAPRPSTSYLCQSTAFTDRVTTSSVDTAYPALAETRLGAFKVAIPSLPKQAAIVRFLDQATENLTKALASAKLEIDLLREYHTRLIADVITGKLDVREAAARLPNEAKEPKPLDEAKVEGECKKPTPTAAPR